MAVLLTDDQLNELFEEIPALAGRPRDLESSPVG